MEILKKKHPARWPYTSSLSCPCERFFCPNYTNYTNPRKGLAQHEPQPNTQVAQHLGFVVVIFGGWPSTRVPKGIDFVITNMHDIYARGAIRLLPGGWDSFWERQRQNVEHKGGLLCDTREMCTWTSCRPNEGVNGWKLLGWLTVNITSIL